MLPHSRGLTAHSFNRQLKRLRHALVVEEARFALMQHIMQASKNLPLQLIARTLYEQIAPNFGAVAEFATPDRQRYAVYARQLENALAKRDIAAVRGTFDALAELNRETMTRAFVLAQEQGREASAQ